jgi:hypothetical protein
VAARDLGAARAAFDEALRVYEAKGDLVDAAFVRGQLEGLDR